MNRIGALVVSGPVKKTQRKPSVVTGLTVWREKCLYKRVVHTKPFGALMIAFATSLFSMTRPADFSDVALFSLSGLLVSTILIHFGFDPGSILRF